MLSERKTELDFARTIAIIFVVLNHVVEKVFPITAGNIASMSLELKFFVFLLFTIGRIGVPIFLFLTGFLLLSRDYNVENTISFYRFKLLRLVIVWEVWILLYNLFLWWFNNISIDFFKIICNALFISEVGMMHEWYMPMIIGVYIFIPHISNMLKHTSNKIVILIMGIVYLHFFCGKCLITLLEKKATFPLEMQLDLGFSGGVYGLYLILGYLLFNNYAYLARVLKERRCYAVSLFCFSIIMLLFTVAFQMISYSIGITYSVWYNFPSIPIIAGCFFLVLIKNHFDTKFASKILGMLSNYAFGVYLIHVPILMVLSRIFLKVNVNPFILLCSLFALVLILSFGVVYIFSKTKHMRKLFLL